MMQEVEISESKISNNPIKFPENFAYDSRWVPATNITTNLIFPHRLGRAPVQTFVVFSPDQETVYPITWSWANQWSGNPVSIKADSKEVTISIWSGTPLHGFFDGTTGTWTKWNSGYFRVLILG
ncbi:hypothetical protein EGY16_11720 [Burkholderia pseudomallei]|nr:hypothetical protein EGY16_11720 [Burkholderia pseudomallei]